MSDERLVQELHVHRLLVAIDGSTNAELALAMAVTAAHRDHATITLLVVVPDVVRESSLWAASAPASPQELQREVDEHAAALLRDTVARIPTDVSVTTRVRRGRPGHEIVAQAQEGDYDAILLGARGVGRVRAATGSVSAHVLHHARIAVFVAHAGTGRAD